MHKVNRPGAVSCLMSIISMQRYLSCTQKMPNSDLCHPLDIPKVACLTRQEHWSFDRGISSRTLYVALIRVMMTTPHGPDWCEFACSSLVYFLPSMPGVVSKVAGVGSYQTGLGRYQTNSSTTGHYSYSMQFHPVCLKSPQSA